VLAILGSPFDKEAVNLAASWQGDGAALLTCRDLSTPGWRYFSGDCAANTAVVSGAVVPVSSIRAVLTRRSAIYAEELTRVSPEDREYVAAEMNAFLLAWLADLECPVLNRPTPGCLSGANWSTAQWVHQAARLGIPVRPFKAFVPGWADHSSEVPAIEVTVAGDRCFGAPDAQVASQARALARAADVQLVSMRFASRGQPAFLGANLLPPLTDPSIVDAVRDWLLAEGGSA
jgi:hypothetical protein